MWLFKKVTDIQGFLNYQKQEGKTIGFVPTMGALHAGHISLIQKSKSTCDITVCSIFVNPTQFNDPADLEKYPRTLEQDIKKLVEADCNVLFFPAVEEIYPDDVQKKYDLGKLENILEGAFRPGHFQGVCMVLDRLFSIIQPGEIFFGQKDYQQCMVVKRLLQDVPGFDDIHMNIVPIIREESGLAMSSRNKRLSPEQLVKAPVIYETLQYLKDHIQKGDLQEYVQVAKDKLIANGFKPDYVSIADADTLQEITVWNGVTPLVALIAAYLGEVRLIDNLKLTD